MLREKKDGWLFYVSYVQLVCWRRPCGCLVCFCRDDERDLRSADHDAEEIAVSGWIHPYR